MKPALLMPLGGLALCVGLGAMPDRHPPALDSSYTAQGCSVLVADSSRLFLSDGRSLYIEPEAVVARGDTILLAGSPNYLSSAASGPESIRSDSIFGALLANETVSVLIARPRDAARIQVVRAASDAHGWHVVYADSVAGGAAASATRLWYTHVDTTGMMTDPEFLPAQAAPGWETTYFSALLAIADTLWWAIVRTRDYDTDNEVVVLTRVGGSWSGSTLRTETWPGSVQLARIGGTTQLVVSMRERAGLYFSELRRFVAAQGRWVLRDILVSSPGLHAVEPQFAGEEYPTVTWLEEESVALAWQGKAFGARIDRNGALSAVTQLAPSAQSATPVALNSGTTAVVVVENNPDSVMSPRIRVMAAGPAGFSRSAAFRSPFDGPFWAGSHPGGGLLLVGARLTPDTLSPTLDNLLLQLTLRCASAPGGAADSPTGENHTTRRVP